MGSMQIMGRTNSKQSYVYIILGTLFICIHLYELIFENRNKFLATFQLIIGFSWLGFGIYLLRNNTIKIVWEHTKLTLKYPGKKTVEFMAAQIKTFTVTQNNLIVNAGKANGEMIEIKFLNSTQKQELLRLQKEINEL